MQRRIEQADTNWQTFHRFEQAKKVGALILGQPRECGAAIIGRFREDHLLQRREASGLEKRMFGSGESDPFRAKAQSNRRL